MDIEPSGCGKGPAGCALDAILFQRCTADYNDGVGFRVDWAGDLTIAFEDCQLAGNGGASFIVANMGPRWNLTNPKSAVPVGSVNISRCIATGGPGLGLLLVDKGLGVPVNAVNPHDNTPSLGHTQDDR